MQLVSETVAYRKFTIAVRSDCWCETLRHLARRSLSVSIKTRV
jgi:hypothetical protein